MEATAKWLIWRRGRFSPDEISAIRRGLDSWLTETSSREGLAKDELLETLKWARENKITAWCDIATRCNLPDRKVVTIRRCILRNFLPGSEVDGWTPEQTREYVRAQEIHGKRAWKAIAQETGRTLEDVVNKGRAMEESKTKMRGSRAALHEALRKKLQELSDRDSITNSNDFINIGGDCELVATIRQHIAPEGPFSTIYNVSWGKLGDLLQLCPLDIRKRWHYAILPDVIKTVFRILGNEDKMDCYLIWMTRLACEGKLIDEDGLQVYPARDWYSMKLHYIMPLWPASLTESRLRQLLRGGRASDLTPLPEAIQSVYSKLMENVSKSDIREAASKHFAEINRLLAQLADKGDQFLAQRSPVDIS